MCCYFQSPDGAETSVDFILKKEYEVMGAFPKGSQSFLLHCRISFGWFSKEQNVQHAQSSAVGAVVSS